MESPDKKKLRAALDRCEASKLHNTLLFLKILIPFHEAHRADCIEPEKLIAGGLRPRQIQDALEVIEVVHKDLRKPRDLKQGVRAVFTGPAYIDETGNEKYIRGISTVPLYQLDMELSRRENRQPWGVKVVICFDSAFGIYRCDERKLSYPITKRRLKYFLFLRQKGTARFDDIAEEFNVKQTSFSKEIGEINTLFKKRLKLSQDLIVHGVAGYQLNTSDFSFSNP